MADAELKTGAAIEHGDKFLLMRFNAGRK